MCSLRLHDRIRGCEQSSSSTGNVVQHAPDRGRLESKEPSKTGEVGASTIPLTRSKSKKVDKLLWRRDVSSNPTIDVPSQMTGSTTRMAMQASRCSHGDVWAGTTRQSSGRERIILAERHDPVSGSRIRQPFAAGTSAPIQ